MRRREQDLQTAAELQLLGVDPVAGRDLVARAQGSRRCSRIASISER